MFTVISSARAAHQLLYQKAMIAGLNALGIEAKASYTDHNLKTEYTACWGWRIGKKLLERGHKVLVMERGYIGDRFKYTSLSLNGLNGHGIFPEYPADNGKRFIEHGGILRPWQQGGEYALILGQVPGDMSLQGQDMVPWYEAMAEKINDLYDLPVIFRQHPDLNKRGLLQRVKGTHGFEGTLSEALSDAQFTVCYNSNSSVDSLLAGIPCVVGDKGSMAWEVASKDISAIEKPDRQEWAYSLAWKQWELKEISSGEALKEIIKML